MSFDIAIEMLRKRPRDDSEEEHSSIGQVDSNDDIAESDGDSDDDWYVWNCRDWSAQGGTMKAVVEHRKQCSNEPKVWFSAKFRFYPRR